MTGQKPVNSALFATLLALPVALCPALASAADAEPPAMMEYGFKGFFNGAPIGLAAGYLATGSKYDSDEWRTLVFGAGIGALVGAGVGVTLGVVDVGQPPPGTGWLVLRDIGYGVGLGAVVGTAVGALILVKSEDTKDVLIGAAWGGLIGSAVGVGFGILEGAAAHRKASAAASPKNLEDVKSPEVPATPPPPSMSVSFSMVGAEGSLVPLPALVGTF
jgi:hypothetical protein